MGTTAAQAKRTHLVPGLFGSSHRPGAPAWSVAVVPGLGDAEDLMDQLEAQGFRTMELRIRDDSAFEVRWCS